MGMKEFLVFVAVVEGKVVVSRVVVVEKVLAFVVVAVEKVVAVLVFLEVVV